MAKKKFNPELLKEEIKRFKMISEYSFYREDSQPEEDNLILGTELEEVDEDPADDSKTANNAAGGTPPDAAGQQTPPQPDPQANNQTPPPQGTGASPDAAPEDDNLFGGDDTSAEMPADDMNLDAAPAPAEDEVEVDVTQLVQASDEAKQSAVMAGQKTDELLAKFGELEQRISNMGKISDKIESLEKEIIKRNPTPVEKLEMRAMDSFPYNIKLSDYFKDIDGYETEQKPKEYVLTNDDVDSYTDKSIKDSFSSPDYEEEDI